MAIEITNLERRWRRGRERSAKVRVYIGVKGEGVLDGFVARRDRPSDLYRREVMPEVLRQLGLQGVRFRWSQKAGCSCGCSPGFILGGAEFGYDVCVTIQATKGEEIQVASDADAGRMSHRADALAANLSISERGC
jgi:hypothetical protein